MACQPGFELIEGVEEAQDGPFIGPLRGGESRAIDPVVHVLVDEGVEIVDLFPDAVLIEVDRVLGETIELAVEHAHEIVVGIGHDAFRDGIPQDRDGEPSPIVWVGGFVGLAKELEPVDGIERMARPFAEGPATLAANRVHDRHADHIFELLEFPHDDRAMGPGTGHGDIEVVAASLGWVAGASVRGYPVLEHIRLPGEGAFDALLVRKLCLDGHG